MHLKKSDLLKWFFIALFVKVILFISTILIIKEGSGVPVNGFWSFISVDSNSYLLPIDHLLHLGKYSPDYRMPGYGIFYLFFRLFFEKPNALNALILLQLLLSSVSVVYLAKLGEVIFQSRKYFYLVFFTYLVIPYVHFFDVYVLTESLATSFFIFSTFHLVQYLKQLKTKSLFFAGLFLSVVIFMKPVYFPLLGLIPFLLLFHFIRKGNNWKKIIFASFLFGLPFLVFDSVWIVRNFIQNKTFSFLNNGLYYPELDDDLTLYLWNFCTTLGESFTFLEDEDSKIQWFFYDVDSLKQNKTIQLIKTLNSPLIFIRRHFLETV